MYFRDGWLGLRRWLDGQKTYSTNSTRLEDQYDHPDYDDDDDDDQLDEDGNCFKSIIIMRVMLIDKQDVESLY